METLGDSNFRDFGKQHSLDDCIKTLSGIRFEQLREIIKLHQQITEDKPQKEVMVDGLRVLIKDLEDCVALAQDYGTCAKNLPLHKRKPYSPMECPLERVLINIESVDECHYNTIRSMAKRELGYSATVEEYYIQFKGVGGMPEEEKLENLLTRVCVKSLEDSVKNNIYKRGLDASVFNYLNHLGLLEQEEVLVYASNDFVRGLYNESKINFKILDEKPSVVDTFTSNWISQFNR